MRPHALIAGLFVLLAAGGAARASNVSCVVQCVPGSSCQVDSPKLSVMKVVESGKVLRIDDCEDAKLTAGTNLQGILNGAAGPKRFVIAKPSRDSFSKTLPTLFAAASCGPAPRCAEESDRARVAGVAGKGIDATVSKRSGTPCALGLPCGVILSSASASEVELIDWPKDGSLRLRAARGATGERTLPVARGRFQLPAGALAAGAAYAYTLVDAAGTEVAAGEFSVLSAKMQADVEADLRAARPKEGGEPSALDRVEVLLQNELAWNALQLTR